MGDIERAPPRLGALTRRLAQFFAVLGLGAPLLAALLHGLVNGDWSAAALGGIALDMAMLPEEFPLILAVFTVMGAVRIATVGVLTRHAAATETTGAATVFCTGKTETSTQNRMVVAFLVVPAAALLHLGRFGAEGLGWTLLGAGSRFAVIKAAKSLLAPRRQAGGATGPQFSPAG